MSAPAVTTKLEVDVSSRVAPVAPAVELRRIRVPAIRSPFVAIVYVRPAATLASRVRLLNSFVAPARLAKVSVPLPASRIVTVPVPADHVADVELFVHVPLMVQADVLIVTTVAAPRIVTLLEIVTVDPGAGRFPGS